MVDDALYSGLQKSQTIDAIIGQLLVSTAYGAELEFKRDAPRIQFDLVIPIESKMGMAQILSALDPLPDVHNHVRIRFYPVQTVRTITDLIDCERARLGNIRTMQNAQASHWNQECPTLVGVTT
jgi:hypothetical protein